MAINEALSEVQGKPTSQATHSYLVNFGTCWQCKVCINTLHILSRYFSCQSNAHCCRSAMQYSWDCLPATHKHFPPNSPRYISWSSMQPHSIMYIQGDFSTHTWVTRQVHRWLYLSIAHKYSTVPPLPNTPALQLS